MLTSTSGGNGEEVGLVKPMRSLRLRVSSFHSPAIECTSFSSGGKFSNELSRSMKL